MTLMCSSCTRSGMAAGRRDDVAMSASSVSGVPVRPVGAMTRTPVVRSVCRCDDVAAGAAGGNCEQHITGAAVGLDKRANTCSAVVVADAGQVAGIADRDRRIARTVVARSGRSALRRSASHRTSSRRCRTNTRGRRRRGFGQQPAGLRDLLQHYTVGKQARKTALASCSAERTAATSLIGTSCCALRCELAWDGPCASLTPIPPVWSAPPSPR